MILTQGSSNVASLEHYVMKSQKCRQTAIDLTYHFLIVVWTNHATHNVTDWVSQCHNHHGHLLIYTLLGWNRNNHQVVVCAAAMSFFAVVYTVKDTDIREDDKPVQTLLLVNLYTHLGSLV